MRTCKFDHKLMDSLKTIRCPICREELSVIGGSLKCQHAHTFDIAASGYVNLLPPGKAGNSHTGDDRNMIKARRAFLETGYYDRISDFAAQCIAEFSFSTDMTILDAGSGDGYHITRIADILSGRLSSAIGIDASKHGAEIAAKAAKCEKREKVSFFAANIFDLPIADSTIDVMISMFAPIPFEEANRVLRDDGILVVIASGRKHLWEMRELLYDTPRESNANIAENSNFSLIASRELSYQFTIAEPDELKALFSMTPFSYKTSVEDASKLNNRYDTNMTANVICAVFKKAECDKL